MSTPRRYLDLELELRRWSPTGFEVAVLPSAAGESDPVAVDMADGELDGAILMLDRGTSTAEDVLRLGRRLGDLLLPAGQIRDLFSDALRKVTDEHAGLRLRLLIRDAPLTAIPWELSYLQLQPGESSERHFLALDPFVSIVRHPPLGEPHPSLGPVDPSHLRLIAVTAQAEPYLPLDLDKERRAIDRAFASFAVPGVEIERVFVTDATMAQVERQLGERVDLFHFGGHGVVESDQIDDRTGRPSRIGSIVLRDDKGGAQLVGAAALAMQLRRGGVRVCVLGACDAGRQDGVSAWNGIAPTLIAEGVPAVVGMQFRIADRAAIRFGEAFYTELARGVSVDEAVASARLAVFNLDVSAWQWAVPVLYMRAADAFIFPVGPRPAVVDPAAPTTAPPGQLPARVWGTRPLAFLREVFDRKAEQLELGQHLANPDVRVVTVVGREGMGKSAIVSAVMAGLEHDRWPDGETAIHVDGIAYFSARDPTFSIDRLFEGCASLLNDDAARKLLDIWKNETRSVPERFDLLLRELATGYRVIVLDDAEVLLTQDGQIRDDRTRSIFETVLSSSSAVHVVLLTRITTDVPARAQQVRRVIEITEGLPVEEAMAMLRALDPDNRLGIRDATDDEVRDAVVKVGRVPRAIELLATQVETQVMGTLSSVVATFFSDESVTRDLIEATYAGLDEADRLVIQALAVYRAPVPMDAVSTLLDPVLPNLDVPSAVVRLVRAHLVIADRASQTVSASAIDQAYAYALLPADGPMSPREAERRAADHFATQRKEPQGWQRVTDLDPQIREFEHRLRAEDPNGASAALATIDRHLAWHGNAELARWLRSRVEGQLTDPLQNALHEYGLGHIAIVQGPLSEAAVHYAKAAELARVAPDARLEALADGWLGEAYRRLGRLEEGMAQFAKAIPALESFGDMPEDVSTIRLLHGLIASYIGDGRTALEEGEWLLAHAGSDVKTRGRAHDCLSLAYLVLGRLDESKEHADAGIAAYEEVDDRESKAYVENVNGMILTQRGRPEEALNHLEAAEQRGVETEQPRIVGLARFNRARAYRALNQPEKALAVVRDSEEVLTKVGAYEKDAAMALRLALESPAQGAAEVELNHLLACARISSRSADLQPPLDLAKEVESRSRQANLNEIAAPASALVAELDARLDPSA